MNLSNLDHNIEKLKEETKMAKTVSAGISPKSCQKNWIVIGQWLALWGRGTTQGIFGNFDKNKM